MTTLRQYINSRSEATRLKLTLIDLLPLIWGLIISLCALGEALSLYTGGRLAFHASVAFAVSLSGVPPRIQVLLFFSFASLSFIIRKLRIIKYKPKNHKRKARGQIPRR